MKTQFPEVLIKIVLIGLELMFVGILCAVRLQIIGWMLVILSIGFIFWVLFHLALMTGFILTMKTSVIDILLYIVLHLFYLVAWLFQSDSPDGGGYVWAIQALGPWPSLNPFLKQYGDTVFMYAFIGTLICYVVTVILVASKLIKAAQARKQTPAPVPASAESTES